MACDNADAGDWETASHLAVVNPLAAYDRMREQCPVARNANGGWTLFRHDDIECVLRDPEIFSNRVSNHLSVPNGLDPPQHSAWRELIEPYFADARIAEQETRCAAIAGQLVRGMTGGGSIEFMSAFARPFAARMQCAFLGWPEDLAKQLSRWTESKEHAVRTRDRETLAAIAEEFADLVHVVLRQCRQEGVGGDDVTSRLLRERIQGRPLEEEEIVSILRNWTVGEVGTLSAAIGILIRFLAGQPAVQQQLRAESALIPAANEEILRLHGPLVENRRITTCPVELGGRRLAAGERVSLNWIAANRDPRAFEAATAYRPERAQSANLLWGVGIHACPGAPLARMEMRVAIEALLAGFTGFEVDPEHELVPARYPASGYEALPLRLR